MDSRHGRISLGEAIDSLRSAPARRQRYISVDTTLVGIRTGFGRLGIQGHGNPAVSLAGHNISMGI